MSNYEQGEMKRNPYIFTRLNLCNCTEAALQAHRLIFTQESIHV
jgi:hypothetical protein